MKKDGDDLSPLVRAEDIILGSLGFGEEARVVSIERTSDGYKGVGRWADGEEFPFESEDEMDELTEWALGLLLESSGASQKIANT
ncbi:MAG: hypothetical protein RIS36_1429 [Pseudomonadota bacterium]|jgi:hypothetical protein